MINQSMKISAEHYRRVTGFDPKPVTREQAIAQVEMLERARKEALNISTKLQHLRDKSQCNITDEDLQK